MKTKDHRLGGADRFPEPASPYSTGTVVVKEVVFSDFFV